MINKEEWFGTEFDLDVEGQHNSLILKHPEIRDDLGSDHPDAQWFKNAGLGMFLHWGISAVDGRIDISWGMLANADYGEYVLNGLTDGEIQEQEENKVFEPMKFRLMPSKYFALAKDFKAEKYDPDEWMRMAKEAGFQYAVLTAKHCDGFMLWPSEYGDYSTKMYLGGRDLVREFVDACRKYGIKVGIYFTPTDWYLNRKHMSFMHYISKRRNPALPEVDENYKAIELPSPEEMERQKKLHGINHRGQLRELLTNYGQIDIIWFDGGSPKTEVFPLKEVYKLQPGIVATTRMHGYGDFKNCEVKFADQKPKGWWEYCTIWSKRLAWAYTNNPEYRPTADIILEFIKTRNWGGNYLLNIGPMASGEFPQPALDGISELTCWMKKYGESVLCTDSLPEGESSNVYATAKENIRYLFVLPDFNGVIELKGITEPKSVVLMSDESGVEYCFRDECLEVKTEPIKRNNIADAIKIVL